MSKSPTKRSNVAYFITFTTYGTWLHGDLRGSHSREFKTRVKPNEKYRKQNEERMVNPAVTFTQRERAILFDAILEFGLCGRYNVFINAVNVRSNHIHVLITPIGDITKPQLVNILKNYLTKIVKSFPRYGDYRRIWTKGFSGANLYDAKVWRNCAYYTLLGQKGGNRYIRLTQFSARKNIRFEVDDEPNADSFFGAFVTARVMFFRKNQLKAPEEDEIEIVEYCDDVDENKSEVNSGDF